MYYWQLFVDGEAQSEMSLTETPDHPDAYKYANDPIWAGFEWVCHGYYPQKETSHEPS